MKVYEYQKLLGILYREDYKEDPIIAKILIESGWAVKRLLDTGAIKKMTDSELKRFKGVYELLYEEELGLQATIFDM